MKYSIYQIKQVITNAGCLILLLRLLTKSYAFIEVSLLNDNNLILNALSYMYLYVTDILLKRSKLF